MRRSRSLAGKALVMLLSGTFGAVPVWAASGEEFNPQTVLVGTWRVSTTPVNCATGLPVGAPTVQSRATFGEGGTITDANSSPRFAPGQRSAGHGRWDRTGNGAYEAVVEAFILFDGAPYTRGVQRIEQVIEVVDADHWSSTAKVDFFDANGVRVPPSGCAVATAERLT